MMQKQGVPYLPIPNRDLNQNAGKLMGDSSTLCTKDDAVMVGECCQSVPIPVIHHYYYYY